MAENGEHSEFVKALGFIGSVVGALAGVGIFADDPSVSPLVAGGVGLFGGAVAGMIAAKALEVAFQILLALLGLAFIAWRFASFANLIAS